MSSDSGRIGCLGVKNTVFARWRSAFAHCMRGITGRAKKCEVWDLLICRAIYLIHGDFVVSPFQASPAKIVMMMMMMMVIMAKKNADE